MTNKRQTELVRHLRSRFDKFAIPVRKFRVRRTLHMRLSRVWQLRSHHYICSQPYFRTAPEYSAKIIELKATNQEFTSTSLVEKVSVKHTYRKTVENVFQEHITSLIKSGRKSYALSVKQLYNSLKEFSHSLDFYFSEMDVTWLKRYELFLREKRLAENTIGIRFRTLRAIYNVAMEENAVSPDCYPFRKFKVARLHLNATEVAIGINNALHGDMKYAWFLG